MPNPPGTHLPNPAHYSTATAEVIEDKVTGLMWQRAVDAGGYSWREAGDYCEHLALAGFTDWRLPARIELVSIIDVSRSEPSIDGVAFPATPIDRFWSSSPEAANPDGAAWTVYFQFGHAKAEPTNSPYRVRCVRTPSGGRRAAAGPAVPPYLVQDEVVRDLGTGLNWQRAAPTPSFTHQQARRYCGSLRLDRKKGWRVPTLGELLTIVDERSSPPSVDGRAFPEPATEASPVTSPRPSQWFWTSSPFADRGAMAWQVSFEYGASRHGPLKEPHRVRCVQ